MKEEKTKPTMGKRNKPEVISATPMTDDNVANIDMADEQRAVAVPAKVRSGTLVPSDPLQQYLAMARQIPKITEEEEHRLAVLLHKNKDEEAAMKLITAHLNVVIKIAFDFHNQFQNMLDLIQEGNIGLMRAVEKFDPFKGVRLPTYASYWIKAYMMKYILDNWRLVRVGTTNMRRKLLFNLNKVTHELQSAGMDAGPKQLAEHFGTTVQEVEAVRQSLGSKDLSMEQPLSEDGGMTYAEVIKSNDANIEDVVIHEEMTSVIRQEAERFAKGLKQSDRDILFNRLMADEPLTLKEIGEKNGITKEAVRQAEARLIKKLKAHLEEAVPEIGGMEVIDDGGHEG